MEGIINILGGTLSCSNFNTGDAVIGLTQAAGSLVVADRFVFSGYYVGTYNGYGARPAVYVLGEGALTAPRIEITATWRLIRSGLVRRVHNSDSITLGGTIELGNATEHLGRLILATNSAIDLAAGAVNLSFDASASERWPSSATLRVENWHGLIEGGGEDQVKFGNDASGLNATQLAHVIFNNPAGLPTGEYPAHILTTGEIVPASSPTLSHGMTPTGLILTWSNGGVLQSSANVEGPYVDIPAAAPPYTVDFASAERLFLRLRP